MRSRSISRSLLTIVCSAAFVVGGCKKEISSSSGGGPSTNGSKKLTIGFSQVGAENAWRTAETNSITSEAKNRDINLKFSDAQSKQENQIAALRGFVAQGVDAIILAPKIETGWEPVLKEVKAAKIPVILVDRGVKVSDDSLYTTLIASDFVEEGRRVGDWLTKKTGGNAKIAEIQGTPGAAPTVDRQKGFAESIAKAPGMKIIMTQTGEFTRAKGKEVMAAFLKSPEGKDITAVYAHNDEMALGAIQAIEAAGKKPGADIVVVSIDGMRDAFQSMVDGKLSATVECNPLMGPAAFDAAAKAVAGEKLPKQTVVQDGIFEQATAKDAIAGRKY
jgi:ABC-type sugar transport system substrate-binding protein